MAEQEPAPLITRAALENLKVIRGYVEAVARQAGLPNVAVYDLILAVDEAATNIMMHGYGVNRPGAQAGLIEVTARWENPALRVTLRDQAPPFDPTAMPEQDELPPLADRMPGGLGIFLIRKTMDEVLYRRTPDGWNELTLIMVRPVTSQEE